MEKKKLTIPYILHHWKDLSTSQKRGVLTLAMFGLAALLIAVTLIIAISTCSCAGRSAQTAETVEPLPALLQPPEGGGRGGMQETASAEVEPDTDEQPPEITDQDDGTNVPDGETITPDGGPDAETDAESTYRTLKKHDRGEDVTALQTRLMELGYLEIEETTDYYGNGTEYAVSLFQRQHGLTQDGVAGVQTQTLLYSKDAHHYAILEGAEGRDVKMLQEQLVDLGYLDSGDVDRVYGEKTVEAVKAFQRRNGLSVDGKAGEKTLAKLFGESAKPSKEMEEQIKAAEKAEKEAEKQKEKTTPTPKPTKKATATPKKSGSSKTTPKPTAKTTPKPTKKPTPTPKNDTRLEKFINTAKSKIGCEYVLGDRGPNTFDCSGFVFYCLRQAGININRMNAEGFSKVSYWKNITKIEDLKKGDILFFRSDNSSSVSHTGIYIGSGMMIDASSSNGKVVKRALTAYFKRNFVNARRPWS